LLVVSAGSVGEGTLFTDPADWRRSAGAAPVVERFRASGSEPGDHTLYAYGAVQVWAQAAEESRSLDLQAMIVRHRALDRELTRVVELQSSPALCRTDVAAAIRVWHADGTYVPVASDMAKD
jgi:branched-chain amino acid transport system substrate-binding protein